MRATPFRPAAVALEGRRNEVANLDAMAGVLMKVWGRILVEGIGGVVVNVKFPAVFIELPRFSGGGEMGFDDPVDPTAWPECNGMVANFEYSSDAATGARRYTGANLVVVTRGRTDMSAFFHWAMEGRAINNPLHSP